MCTALTWKCKPNPGCEPASAQVMRFPNQLRSLVLPAHILAGADLLNCSGHAVALT